jgi:thymidylate synthase (FAD)
MRKVEIRINCIAQTRLNFDQIEAWLKGVGVSTDTLKELALSGVSEASKLIALAAKRCYMSFQPGLNPNVTQVRKDLVAYLDNILKQSHGSVLEHATWTFAIEGVSRVFTGEMNRHRAGVAISEGSMRYIRFDDIPYWEPTSIRLTEEEENQLHVVDRESLDAVGKEIYDFRKAKEATQRVFEKAFTQDQENYKELQDIWAKWLTPESKFKGKKRITSLMRRTIGMGVATGGVWTVNMRALRHIIAMRTSEAAEEEIMHVWSRIAGFMTRHEEALLGDFTESPEGYWTPKYHKV